MNPLAVSSDLDIGARAVVALPDGLEIDTGGEAWFVDPIRLVSGEWLTLAPAGDAPLRDPGAHLARQLATLQPPPPGRLRLLGHDPARLDYPQLRRLRAHVGFVHRRGGLLSARSLRENVALPVSVHGPPDERDEETVVDDTLAELDLHRVADLRPHAVDDVIRWRACVARAVVRSPYWLVLEGMGDWELERGRGVAWTSLRRRRDTHVGALVVCLRQVQPAFEAWFEAEGGQVVHYEKPKPASSTGSTA